jgi:hypothetical protein
MQAKMSGALVTVNAEACEAAGSATAVDGGHTRACRCMQSGCGQPNPLNPKIRTFMPVYAGCRSQARQLCTILATSSGCGWSHTCEHGPMFRNADARYNCMTRC